MRARRTAATIALASLILAACGPGDTGSSEGPAETDPVAPAVDDSDAEAEPQAADNEDDVNEDSSEPAPDEPDADEPAPADEDPADDPVDEPADEPAGDSEPEPDDVVPAMAWPDDGCSADNSPTPTDLADGPAPVLELRPESADGPLPGVAVRRLNCNGGWVNFQNELPSELPLLVWFWAPH